MPELANRLQAAIDNNHGSVGTWEPINSDGVESTCLKNVHAGCSKQIETAVREIGDKFTQEIDKLRSEIHGNHISKSPLMEKSNNK